MTHLKKKVRKNSSRKTVGTAGSKTKIESLVTLFGQNRLAEAEVLSRSFTQLYPQNGLGWIKNLSLVLIALGRHKEAISTLHRAIALNPNDADVYVNLGGMLQRLGQIADAIDAFRNAIRINPEFPLASSGLLFCMGHDLWTDPKQLFAEHLAFGVNGCRKARKYGGAKKQGVSADKSRIVERTIQ